MVVVSAHPERPVVDQARRPLPLLLRLFLLLQLPHVRLLLLLLLSHVLSGVLLRLLSKARLACSRRQGAWEGQRQRFEQQLQHEGTPSWLHQTQQLQLQIRQPQGP